MSRSYGFIRRNGIKKGDGDMAEKEMLQKKCRRVFPVTELYAAI